MRNAMNRGRVYRRCGCRDQDRRQLGAKCPQLAKAEHGTWTFAVDLPASGGPRKTVRRGGFSSNDQAATALRRFHEGRAQGFDSDPNQTVAQYLRAWLKQRKESLKPSTYSRYRATVENDLLPAFGQVRLEELSHDHIAAFAQRELDADRGRPTVYKCLTTLSSAMGHAVRTHRIDYNPAQPTYIPRPAAEERTIWNAEEAVKFLAHCRTADPQYADLFELIIGTGLRKGEALALHWDHAPIEERILKIRYTLSSVDDRLFLTTPKTKKSKAWVAISDRTAQALHNRARHKAPAGPGTQHGGHVFHHPDGRPLHPKDVLARFHKLRRDADVPHCTIHDLRHLTATLSLEAGVPMPVTSKTLRHSTLSTTANVYSHLTQPAARGAVEAVARLLAAAEGDNHATVVHPQAKQPRTWKNLLRRQVGTTALAA